MKTSESTPARSRAPGPQTPCEAAQVFDGLGDWVAKVDAKCGKVTWSTQALRDRHAGWHADQRLDELYPLFPGLDQAIAIGAAAARPLRVGAPAGRVLEAQVAETPDGLLLRLTDVTDRLDAAARHLADREGLMSISRTTMVGEMALTLSHELNQPVGAITNTLRGLLAHLQQGQLDASVADAAIRRAIDQAQYVSGVVSRIRSHVSARQPRKQRLDLSAMAKTSLELLDWELQREGIDLRLDLAAGPAAVHGDAAMLQQVIVNLARNAIDAMHSTVGKTLVLRVVQDEEQAELQVVDCGVGIPEAASERVYSPLFSTKAAGIGMGLSVCRSIVELHGGRLWHTPNAEIGCTFHMGLPCASTADGGAASDHIAQRQR